MFFIFDSKKPITILFYIFIIALAFILDELEIMEVEEALAVFILVGIGLYLYIWRAK
jgi:hypothetical protein